MDDDVVPANAKPLEVYEEVKMEPTIIVDHFTSRTDPSRAKCVPFSAQQRPTCMAAPWHD